MVLPACDKWLIHFSLTTYKKGEMPSLTLEDEADGKRLA